MKLIGPCNVDVSRLALGSQERTPQAPPFIGPFPTRVHIGWAKLEEKMIDISGINKAELLAGLYNSSKPLGLGIAHYDPKPMTVDEAARVIDRGCMSFDYLNGRVMKIDIDGDTLDPWLYDRDNGEGAAAGIVESLKSAVKS